MARDGAQFLDEIHCDLRFTSFVGHEGNLYAAEVEGVVTLALAGRVHLYEGHDSAAVTHAVRSAIEAGCDVVISPTRRVR